MPPRFASRRLGPLTVYLLERDGCVDLASLVHHLPSDMPVVWLDSGRAHPRTGRWSLAGFDPWLELSARNGLITLRTSRASRRWRGHPLEALRRVLRRYRGASIDPRLGQLGLLGAMSYELNRWVERLPDPPGEGLRVPDMTWFGMRQTVLVDHVRERTWLLATVDPHRRGASAHREALEGLEQLTARVDGPPAPVVNRLPRLRIEPTLTQAGFEEMVRRVLEHVRAGDLYQANLSHRMSAAWPGPALPLFLRLRALNPSPFACYAAFHGLSLVSCSPERLVRVCGDRVDARPIAGTRPRGTTPVEEAVNGLDLLTSEKERAEHIMLVDLARTDLGRLSEPGSVRVRELMGVETYSHVLHIVSDVAGRLRPELDATDVIRALFPGGTITGCPKVRCMQLLSELEPVRRGFYTGSAGYLGWGGDLDLNILIRTITVQGGQASFHAGAGIVADSDPGREYRETIAKAAALMEALGAGPAVTQDPHEAVH
jgi:anthranilate/para-aminobenzoate synthase component I